MRDYFSSYGNIVEHKIIFDNITKESMGYGFVTFENEDAVEKILSDDRMHELGGNQVSIVFSDIVALKVGKVTYHVIT